MDNSPAEDWRSPEPEVEAERTTFPQRRADVLGLLAEAWWEQACPRMAVPEQGIRA